jgi:hypothetical protein
MARYSAFLGRRVEVQYRAGDILLPASGTFVADSGRSIFLEQQFEQHGNHRHFRWEIPYQYIVRLGEKADVSQASPNLAEVKETATSPEQASDSHGRAEQSVNAANSVAGGAPNILPLQNRPKTA